MTGLICQWPGHFCGNEVRTDIPICHEHALLVWSVIQRDIAESQRTPEQLREDVERRKREKEDRRLARLGRVRQPGVVYYIQVGERIKIGYTADLPSRMRAYPPETTVLWTEPGTLADEAALHQRFTPYRIAGREWYEAAPALLNHIQHLKDTNAEARAARREASRRAAAAAARPIRRRTA